MSLTACFTGHRPGKLGGYDPNNQVNLKIRTALHNKIAEAISYNITTFISGGALGVDQWAAESVLSYRDIDARIKLIIARPFPSQASKWPKDSQAYYQTLLARADKVVDISPDPYSVNKMQLRNTWMVDQSHAIIAVWDGIEAGGTWGCIKYAKEKGKLIEYINTK